MDNTQLKIKRYQKVLTDYVTQLAAEYNDSLGSSKTYQAVTDILFKVRCFFEHKN